LHIAIDLLPGRRNIHAKRTELEPEVAILPEHQDVLSIKRLEGLDVAVDLLPDRRDVHAERTVIEPEVAIPREHQQGLSVERLEGLDVAIDLLSRWRHLLVPFYAPQICIVDIGIRREPVQDYCQWIEFSPCRYAFFLQG
jgi:hypothetical protein